MKTDERAIYLVGSVYKTSDKTRLVIFRPFKIGSCFVLKDNINNKRYFHLLGGFSVFLLLVLSVEHLCHRLCIHGFSLDA